MLASMTGFGSGTAEFNGRRIVVEVRSVNHRYLEVKTKSAQDSLFVEDVIRTAVHERFGRGYFSVRLLVEQTENTPATDIRADLPLARAYISILKGLQEELGIPGEVNLQMLASFNSIVTYREPSFDTDNFRKSLAIAARNALDSLEKMRKEEGAHIHGVLRGHIDAIDGLIGRIKERIPQVVPERRDRMRDRIKDLLDTGPVDETRLMNEIAFLADRYDITEEVNRLHSHISQFRKLLTQPARPLGREMDFLAQEMNREINTLGAKANDDAINRLVIQLKTELESIREQVQNVE